LSSRLEQFEGHLRINFDDKCSILVENGVFFASSFNSIIEQINKGKKRSDHLTPTECEIIKKMYYAGRENDS
jgi:hypothetical protein